MPSHQLSFADYLAICETKARYCRTLDTKDWDGFAAVFTEDLVLDTTGSGGGVIEGRTAAIVRVRHLIEKAHTAHQVHSPEIAYDGNSAEVIWAMQDRVVWPRDVAERTGTWGLTGYGQYVERYQRSPDGGWRISHVQLLRFHVDLDPPPVGDS